MKKVTVALVAVLLLLCMSLTLVACNKDKVADGPVVRFFVDGAEYKRIEINASFALPDDPTKEGETFVGWYLDRELTQPFDVQTVLSGSVTENLSVYAKFKQGGGSVGTAVAKEVKYQAPATPTYSNDEAFAAFLPVVEYAVGEMTETDKRIFKEERFDDILDFVIKPSGMSIKEIEFLATTMKTVRDKSEELENAIKAKGLDLDNFDEICKTDEMQKYVKDVFFTISNLMISMDANRMIVFVDCLMNYMMYEGLDPVENLYDDDMYEPVARKTMEKIFGEKGVVGFDLLSKISSAIKTDEGATVVGNVMDVLVKALSYDPAEIMDIISILGGYYTGTARVIAKEVSMASSDGAMAEDATSTEISKESLAKAVNGLGKWLAYALEELDGERLYAFLKPILARNGIDSEECVFSEICLRPECLRALVKVLSEVSADDLYTISLLTTKGIDIDDPEEFEEIKKEYNLSNKDIVSAINFAGKALNIFLDEVKDEKFYTIALAPIVNALVSGESNKKVGSYSTKLVRIELLQAVADLLETADEGKLSAIYNAYEDYDKKKEEEASRDKTLGYFFASVLDFIAPEYKKLSQATRTAINEFATGGLLYDGTFTTDLDEVIALLGADYKKLNDATLVNIKTKVRAIENKVGTLKDKFTLLCRYAAIDGIVIPVEATEEEVAKLLEVSGYYFYDPVNYRSYEVSKVAFTYAISGSELQLSGDLIEAGTKVPVISADSKKYELIYSETKALYIRMPLNETKENVMLRVQDKLVSDDFVVYNADKGQYLSTYLEKSWLNDGLFALKDVKGFSSAKAGLYAGTAVVSCFLGEMEVPFLYRVYDPDTLQAVGIDYTYRYYYTPEGDSNENSGTSDYIALPIGAKAEDVVKSADFTIHYDSGETGKLYQDFTVTGFKSDKVGVGRCTVTYQGLSVTAKYRIYDPADPQVRYIGPGRDTYSYSRIFGSYSYVIGVTLDMGATEADLLREANAYVMYESHEYKRLPDSGYTLEGFDAKTATAEGEYRTATLTYGGCTLTIRYTVEDPALANVYHLNSMSLYYFDELGWGNSSFYGRDYSSAWSSYDYKDGKYVNYYYSSFAKYPKGASLETDVLPYLRLLGSYSTKKGASYQADISFEDCVIGEFDAETVGYHYLTFTYEGQTLTYRYSIYDPTEPKVTSIEYGSNRIEIGATQDTFFEKMEFYARLDSGERKDFYEDYTIEGYVGDTVGWHDCTITYEGVTQSVSYYVYDRNHPIVEYIYRGNNYYNDRFPLNATKTDLVARANIRIVYDNGDIEPLASDYEVTGFRSDIPGYRTCVLKYESGSYTYSCYLSYKIYDPEHPVAEDISYNTIKIPVGSELSDFLLAANFRVTYDSGESKAAESGAVTVDGYVNGKRGQYVCTVKIGEIKRSVFYTLYDRENPVTEGLKSDYSYYGYMRYGEYVRQGTDVSGANGTSYYYSGLRLPKGTTKDRFLEMAKITALYDYSTEWFPVTMDTPRLTFQDFDTSTVGYRSIYVGVGEQSVRVWCYVYDPENPVIEKLTTSSYARFAKGTTGADVKEGSLVVAYMDNCEAKLVTDFTLTGFASDQAGERRAVVEKSGKYATLQYYIYDPEHLKLLSVDVDIESKYIPLGMTEAQLREIIHVYGDYDSGEDKQITDYEIKNFDKLQKAGYRNCVIVAGGLTKTLYVRIYDPENPVVDRLYVADYPSRIPNTTTWEDFKEMLTVRAAIDSGNTVPVTDYTSSDFSTAKVGNCTCTITYKGKSKILSFKVYDPEHPIVEDFYARYGYSYGTSRIPNTMTEEAFREGISAYAYLDSGEYRYDVTDYELDGFDMSTTGEHRCVLTYEGKTTTLTYIVYDAANPAVESLSVSGASWIAKGTKAEDLVLTVLAYFEDGSSKTLTADEYELSGFSSPAVSDGVFIVTYKGKEQSISYSVYDPDTTLVGGSLWGEAVVITDEDLSKDVMITGNYVYFAYTPTEEKSAIYSISDRDTYAQLWSGTEPWMLTSDDDGGDGNNFYIDYPMTAGETYVIAVHLYGSGSAMITLVIE